ncbi:MAG: FliM/FliN family flagellar motor switch protein [Planctomycetota bacterium]
MSDPAANDPEPDSETAEAGSVTEMVEVKDLEIPIQFGLGNVDVALSRLDSIQAGYVFELGTPIDQPVVVRSGGTSIGRGSLVQIGDRLGVRITEWK